MSRWLMHVLVVCDISLVYKLSDRFRVYKCNKCLNIAFINGKNNSICSIRPFAGKITPADKMFVNFFMAI